MFFPFMTKMQGFLDKSGLFIFYLFIYAEIQDSRQKWRENMCVKNFVEIALSLTVSEISGFLGLRKKFEMAAKSGEKTIFAKSRQ